MNIKTPVPDINKSVFTGESQQQVQDKINVLNKFLDAAGVNPSLQLKDFFTLSKIDRTAFVQNAPKVLADLKPTSTKADVENALNILNKHLHHRRAKQLEMKISLLNDYLYNSNLPTFGDYLNNKKIPQDAFLKGLPTQSVDEKIFAANNKAPALLTYAQNLHNGYVNEVARFINTAPDTVDSKTIIDAFRKPVEASNHNAIGKSVVVSHVASPVASAISKLAPIASAVVSPPSSPVVSNVAPAQEAPISSPMQPAPMQPATQPVFTQPIYSPVVSNVAPAQATPISAPMQPAPIQPVSQPVSSGGGGGDGGGDGGYSDGDTGTGSAGNLATDDNGYLVGFDGNGNPYGYDANGNYMGQSGVRDESGNILAAIPGVGSFTNDANNNLVGFDGNGNPYGYDANGNYMGYGGAFDANGNSLSNSADGNYLNFTADPKVQAMIDAVLPGGSDQTFSLQAAMPNDSENAKKWIYSAIVTGNKLDQNVVGGYDTYNWDSHKLSQAMIWGRMSNPDWTKYLSTLKVGGSGGTKPNPKDAEIATFNNITGTTGNVGDYNYPGIEKYTDPNAQPGLQRQKSTAQLLGNDLSKEAKAIANAAKKVSLHDVLHDLNRINPLMVAIRGLIELMLEKNILDISPSAYKEFQGNTASYKKQVDIYTALGGEESHYRGAIQKGKDAKKFPVDGGIFLGADGKYYADDTEADDDTPSSDGSNTPSLTPQQQQQAQQAVGQAVGAAGGGLTAADKAAIDAGAPAVAGIITASTGGTGAAIAVPAAGAIVGIANALPTSSPANPKNSKSSLNPKSPDYKEPPAKASFFSTNKTWLYVGGAIVLAGIIGLGIYYFSKNKK